MRAAFFLAHALLTGYAATVQIASYRSAPREQFVRIALVDGPPGAEHGQADGTDPAAGPAAAKNPPLAAIPADKDHAAVKKVADLSAPKSRRLWKRSRSRQRHGLRRATQKAAEAIGGHGLAQLPGGRWPKRQESTCRTSARPMPPN